MRGYGEQTLAAAGISKESWLEVVPKKATILKTVIPTKVGIQVALLAGMKAFLQVTLNETSSAYQVTQPQPNNTPHTPDTHAADPII